MRTLFKVGMGTAFYLFASTTCFAGSVTANQNVGMGGGTTFSNTNGFMNVAAFSRFMNQTNAAINSSVTFGGNTFTPSGPGSPFKNGTNITNSTIFVPNGTTRIGLSGRPVPNGAFLGPLAQNTGINGFALTKSNLKQTGDIYAISSTTADWIGTARVTFNGAAGAKYSLSAIASGGTAPGASAARVSDPIDIPAGSYSYTPDININLDVDPGESGDAREYAVDGSTFTADGVENYSTDGEPLANALWSLEMGSNGASDNTSDVDVDFELNPLALNEITFPSGYLSGLGGFSNQSQELSLIDQSMDNTITADESFTGNSDTLTEVDPFPTGTMYSPAANNEEYNYGADAAIEVPEPGTLCLLALGACLLGRRAGRLCESADTSAKK